jgi:HK97 family phage portal protein
MALADVFACVRALAEAASVLPLHPYRRTDAGRQRLTSGQLVQLLDRPAPGVTQSGLVGTTVAHLATRGNAYWGKYRDADGRIAQLGAIDPTCVQVVIERGQPVFELSLQSGLVRVGPSDVLHVRMPLSLDGVLGLGPIQATRYALSHSESLALQSKRFATNGARPSALVKSPMRLKQDQRDKLKQELRDLYSGDEKTGDIALVDGGLEWQALSLSAADAQWVEQRQYSAAEVCRMFRMPPWMVGLPSGDSLTYSTTEGQAAAFVKFTLSSYLVAIEQAVTADRDLCAGNIYAEFLVDALLRADAKTRADVYALALDPERGWMTRAEVRDLENLAPEGTP